MYSPVSAICGGEDEVSTVSANTKNRMELANKKQYKMAAFTVMESLTPFESIVYTMMVMELNKAVTACITAIGNREKIIKKLITNCLDCDRV